MSARIEQQVIKHHIHQCRRKELNGMSESIMNALPSELRACAAAAKEKGVSSWLSALPIEQHGFALHKGDFRDAVALPYNWPQKWVTGQGACGQQFSVHHALICRCGMFILQKHNQVRDLTANALWLVAANVTFEPMLQPFSCENLANQRILKTTLG